MWAEMKLNVICPSDWIADCAKRSAVFRDQPIRVVRTGVDTLVFRSAGRATARRVLGLPEDREIVLIGSVNVYGGPRKGGRKAEETIRRIADRRDRSKLLVACFGLLNTVFEDTGVEVRNFGVLADDISLALLYSAADVFVAPSKEENLANTVLESLACGTPVVSFNILAVCRMRSFIRSRAIWQKLMMRKILLKESNGLWQKIGMREKLFCKNSFPLQLKRQPI